MKRRTIAIAVLALVVVVGVLLTARGRRRASGPTNAATTASTPSPGSAAPTPRARAAAMPDPRTLSPATLRGVVREPGGAPLAGAQVCTRWWADGLASADTREPVCVLTGADGAYRLAPLVPGRHQPSASAAGHLPRAYRAAVGRRDSIELVAGQVVDGIDFVLAPGGVEVVGVVNDVSGGPIADARVTISPSMSWSGGVSTGKTDGQGRFSLWAAPGAIDVSAAAEGYADGSAEAVAPARAVEVLLTPESGLGGVVVEAGSGQPVADVLVAVEGNGEGSGPSFGREASARTDRDGRFRLERLAPGRYKPTATGRGVYGEPVESVLLGLGQRRDDLRIEVHPARVVTGRIEIDDGGPRTPCTDGALGLTGQGAGRNEYARVDGQGRVELVAIRPGTYDVTVRCDGYLEQDHYPPVVVGDADVAGLVWTVSSGGSIRGTVRTADGTPVADVEVGAQTVGGAARGQRSWGGDLTRDDGTFLLTGLVAGDYELRIWSDGLRAPEPPPRAKVERGKETRADVVLPASGEIAGIVVEPDGTPVAGAEVNVVSRGRAFFGGSRARAGEDGRFVVRGVEPGERRVVASRGWGDPLRKPGTTDDDLQGERVKVVAGKAASVRLVVEARGGRITGTVRDEGGQPVVDAWVVTSRESDAAGALAGSAARETRWAWARGDRPVVTDQGGAFTVGSLAPGRHVVRAYRRGGGEAVAEHVEVGATVALVIRATGSIAGAVTTAAGAPVEELQVSVRDPASGVARSESFYRTGGRFALHDLPAGTFAITATAPGGRALQEVTLGAGEDKAGLALVLATNLTVTGRFVDLDSGAPVPGLMARVQPRKGDTGSFVFGSGQGGERKHISGDDGRFEVAEAAPGKDYLIGFPTDFANGAYGFVRQPIEVAGSGTIDLGDVPAVRRRLAQGEVRGDLGLRWLELPPDTEPEAYRLEVSHVRAGGPAAAAGVKAGDVVVAVDGRDVRGARSALAYTLLAVPVGTKLTLGLARGDTVEVTAGPPP